VLVDHRLERPASAARLGLQPGGHVIFKCQGRAHITMLRDWHHDVHGGPAKQAHSAGTRTGSSKRDLAIAHAVFYTGARTPKR
jgi:hypothetical protein